MVVAKVIRETAGSKQAVQKFDMRDLISKG
jgi:hypothetical protein